MWRLEEKKLTFDSFGASEGDHVANSSSSGKNLIL